MHIRWVITELKFSKDSLGVRHHGRETPVGGGDRGQAVRTAIGVERVNLRGTTMVVHKTHGGQHLGHIALMREIGKTFAMGDRDRRSGPRHALEKQTGRILHLNHRQAGFKTLALVGREARPVRSTWDDLDQFGKHLTAIAHAQAKAVLTLKKCLELIVERAVEQNTPRPAHACAQGVAVAKAAAGHQTLKIFQRGSALLQVGHVNVVSLKTCFSKSVGHFHMRIHALLAQHRHPGASSVNKSRRGGRVKKLRRQGKMQTWVAGVARSSMFGIGAIGVVAFVGDFPAHAVPDLMQVLQSRRKNFLGVTPHRDGRRRVG